MSGKRRLSTRAKGESPLEKRIKKEEAALVSPSKRKARQTSPKSSTRTSAKIHARGRRSMRLDRHSHVEDLDTPMSSPAPSTQPPLPILNRDDSPTRPELLQSIADSGILASSMAMSRSKWTTETIFPKYWTRPRTSKGKIIEPLGNPPKDSMSRLGRCRLTIEPHTFELILWSIKDPQKHPDSQPLTSAGSQSGHPIIQYQSNSLLPAPSASVTIQPPLRKPTASAGSQSSLEQESKTSSTSQPPVPQFGAPESAGMTSLPASKPLPAKPPTSPMPPPPTESSEAATRNLTPSALQPAQHAHGPVGAAKVEAATSPIPESSKTALPAPASQAHPQLPPQSRPVPQAQPVHEGSLPPPPPGRVPPSQDPVIQMLAHRASANPDLKALMKTVASGQANKDQLNEFQGHIDELNKIIAQQRRAGYLPPLPPPPAPPFSPHMDSRHAVGQKPLPGYGYGYQPPSTSQHHQKGPQMHPIGAPKPPSNTLKSKPALPPPPKPIGITMEFPGSQDRFLFPKHALLEVFPGGTDARASFLVVKKAIPDQSHSLRPETEYHQPVTVYLSVEDQKMMNVIAGTLMPVDAAKTHMDTIVARTVRAPSDCLALQTPRPDGGTAVEKEAEEDAVELSRIDRRKSIRAAQQGQDFPVVQNLMRGRYHRTTANEEFPQLCRYCFQDLGRARNDRSDGLACASCQDLVSRSAKRTIGNLSTFVRLPEEDRHATGLSTLTLEA